MKQRRFGMPRNMFLPLIVVFILVFTARVDALTLSVKSDKGTIVTVADNGPGDLNPAEGQIAVNTPIDDFVMQVTTAISKPVTGGDNLAEFDISSSAVAGASGGTVEISLTDTDFWFTNTTGSAVLTSAIGGTTHGTITYQSYLDTTNQEFGIINACSSGLQGPFPPVSFDNTKTTECVQAGTFSLTAVATMTLPAKENTSFGSKTFAVPKTCGGTIGDFVWHDVNRDGLQEPDEPGINNVKVELLNTAGQVIATTSTANDANTGKAGYYQFIGLCAGEYRVQVETPSGLFPTTPNVGTDDTLDSDLSPVTVVLPSDNSTDSSIDFGFQSPCAATIGDLVWHDYNRDGLQESGEAGIPNISVTLKDASGNVLANATTDANGNYSFPGRCAGNYTVEVVPPTGFTPSPSFVGSDNTIDSNGVASGAVIAASVTLPDSDTSDLTIDFGFLAPCSGTIGDFVWQDLNHDGIQDSGEPGMKGLAVTLKDTSGTTIKSTTTGQDGYYQFTGLCHGSYIVEAPTPAGYVPSPSLAGSDTTDDSNGSPATVTLPDDNSEDQTIDFGFYTPCTGEIGDFVWYDTNRDGLQDADETGIAGVPVELRDAAGTVLATTTTQADGTYVFKGLCAGAYKVAVATPAGFSPTGCNVGADDTIDSECSPAQVMLPTDSAKDYTIDFGFVSTCSGIIGDFVWNDENRNGLQDTGEPGLPNVTVKLRDLTGTVLQTAYTDASGYYRFTGLCPGCYKVEVVAPAGFTPTISNAGRDDLDSDCNPAKVCLIYDDSVNNTIDFGFKTKCSSCTGKIGNYVWKDLDADGLQESNEPGFGGVKVYLKNATTNAVIATTITSTNKCKLGYYQFSGLCAGAYKVEVEKPCGYDLTKSLAGSNRAIDSNGSPTIVTLSGNNTVDSTIDFGLRKAKPLGTGTPGYWKNHPEEWPVDNITIGGKTYSKDYAIQLMSKSVCGDSTYTMFKELVAAVLNSLAGNDDSCISSTIAAADSWLTKYPLGARITPCSQAWKAGQPLTDKLDDYNKGWLCARSRDRTIQCGCISGKH